MFVDMIYSIKFLSILYRNSDHILHVLYFRVSVDVGYHLKRLEIGDKQKATIQLWDIPGNSNWIIDENIYIKCLEYNNTLARCPYLTLQIFLMQVMRDSVE